VTAGNSERNYGLKKKTKIFPPVLGTAQMGLRYGIANKTGMPSIETAIDIIHEAWRQGIREFDTAQSYGVSERVLGTAISKFGIGDRAKVISKLGRLAAPMGTADLMRAVEDSLSLLSVPSLYGLLLHDENLLTYWDGNKDKIVRSLLDSGMLKHFGVSVYSPRMALHATRIESIDIIQIPFNILDRRFERSGVFEAALQSGKKIYLRSVFLQGLLQMQPDDVPETMTFAKPVIQKVSDFSREWGFQTGELALGFAKTAVPGAKVIFGAETPEQVSVNAALFKKEFPKTLIPLVREHFNRIDERILNPSQWPRPEERH